MKWIETLKNSQHPENDEISALKVRKIHLSPRFVELVQVCSSNIFETCISVFQSLFDWLMLGNLNELFAKIA